MRAAVRAGAAASSRINLNWKTASPVAGSVTSTRIGAQYDGVQNAASHPGARPLARSTSFALAGPATCRRYFRAAEVAVATFAPVHASSFKRVGTAIDAASVSAASIPAFSRAQLVSGCNQPQHERE